MLQGAISAIQPTMGEIIEGARIGNGPYVVF